MRTIDAEINITSHANKTLDELKQAAARALEKAGLTAENYAKLACPVDTGRLRNSISHAAANHGRFFLECYSVIRSKTYNSAVFADYVSLKSTEKIAMIYI